MAYETFLVAQLALKGYKCSHILVQIGLDAQDKCNPELLRAGPARASRSAPGPARDSPTPGRATIEARWRMDSDTSRRCRPARASARAGVGRRARRSSAPSASGRSSHPAARELRGRTPVLGWDARALAAAGMRCYLHA